MSTKKKFKDSTVGKIILGAAGVINPTLANVLQGVTNPKDALSEITKSNIAIDDKIKFIIIRININYTYYNTKQCYY